MESIVEAVQMGRLYAALQGRGHAEAVWYQVLEVLPDPFEVILPAVFVDLIRDEEVRLHASRWALHQLIVDLHDGGSIDKSLLDTPYDATQGWEMRFRLVRLTLTIMESLKPTIEGVWYHQYAVIDFMLMASKQPRPLISDMVDDTLTGMIRVGCSVIQLSYFNTPSRVARMAGFWQQWCRALRTCDKDIREVVGKDDDDWLLT